MIEISSFKNKTKHYLKTFKLIILKFKSNWRTNGDPNNPYAILETFSHSAWTNVSGLQRISGKTVTENVQNNLNLIKRFKTKY